MLESKQKASPDIMGCHMLEEKASRGIKGCHMLEEKASRGFKWCISLKRRLAEASREQITAAFGWSFCSII